MFNGCGIMKTYKARPEALVTPMDARLINLIERFFAMSELYHAAQLPFDFSSIEHATPNCACIGKCCTGCKKIQCILAFNRHRRYKDGRRNICRTCQSEENRCYKKRHPDARRLAGKRYLQNHPEYNSAYHLRSHLGKYGLAVEDYHKMLESQGGVCAICKRPAPQHKIHKRLSIDHDHATGKVRGLLCHRCNTLLGAAEDNVETLKSAIGYLERSEKGGN